MVKDGGRTISGCVVRDVGGGGECRLTIDEFSNSEYEGGGGEERVGAKGKGWKGKGGGGGGGGGGDGLEVSKDGGVKDDDWRFEGLTDGPGNVRKSNGESKASKMKKEKINDFFERNYSKNGNVAAYPSRRTKDLEKELETKWKSACTFAPKICKKSKTIAENEVQPFFDRVNQGEYTTNRDQKLKKKWVDKLGGDIDKKKRKEEEPPRKYTKSKQQARNLQGVKPDHEFDNMLTRNKQWVHNKERKIHNELQKIQEQSTQELTFNPDTNKKFNQNIRHGFMNRLEFDIHKRYFFSLKPGIEMPTKEN